jgi:hypothetical protein
MILHSVLLALYFLEVCPNLGYTFTYRGGSFFRATNRLIELTVLEVILQLFICFICITMGSDEYLRKYKLTLYVIMQGMPILIYKRKDSYVSSFVTSERD